MEDSRSTRLSHSGIPSPTIDLPLQASQSTEDNCTLLTRLRNLRYLERKQLLTNLISDCLRMESVPKKTCARCKVVCDVKLYLKTAENRRCRRGNGTGCKFGPVPWCTFRPNLLKGTNHVFRSMNLLLVIWSTCRHQRSDFKREPCKMVSLTGCQVFYCDAALHQDSFQLVDHGRGKYL